MLRKKPVSLHVKDNSDHEIRKTRNRKYHQDLFIYGDSVVQIIESSS